MVTEGAVGRPASDCCRHLSPTDHYQAQRRGGVPDPEGIPGTHQEWRALRLVQTPHIGDLRLGGDLSTGRRRGHEVVLDEAAVSREPDWCEQVPLRTGDEDVGADHGPPRGGVQPRTEHDRGSQCGGTAVAAVGQRGKRGSAQAVVANPAVAEERPARAAQLVVVQSRDDRYRGVAAGVQDRRRDQRKDVVDVDDIRREARPATG